MLIIDNENEKYINKLKELKQQKFKTLIILGGTWVWKTFLVKNIFQDAYFIDEPEFKQQIVSGGARLRTPEEWGQSLWIFPLEALSKMPFVIYDDYWTADLTAAYIEKMLYWINRRHNYNLPLIVTTNLTIKEFEEREKRISSRLLENALLLEMQGKDRRKKETQIIKL